MLTVLVLSLLSVLFLNVIPVYADTQEIGTGGNYKLKSSEKIYIANSPHDEFVIAIDLYDGNPSNTVKYLLPNDTDIMRIIRNNKEAPIVLDNYHIEKIGTEQITQYDEKDEPRYIHFIDKAEMVNYIEDTYSNDNELEDVSQSNKESLSSISKEESGDKNILSKLFLNPISVFLSVVLLGVILFLIEFKKSRKK